MALRRYLPITWFYLLRLAWGLAFIWLDQFARHLPYARVSVAFISAARLSLLPTVHFTLALRLSDRFPISRDMSMRAVVYHCFAALTLPAAVQLSLIFALPISRVLLRPQQPSWLVFAQDAVTYLLYVGICQALRSMPSSGVIETTRSRLVSAVEDASRRRARAHVSALTTELDSQLLSNSLTTVLPLVRTDVAAADRVLARLTDILHATVGKSRENETTLAEELQSLDPFVEIERARLGDHLGVHVDVPEALMDAYVPTLLLHSLFAATAQRLSGTHGPCEIRIAVASAGTRADLIEIAAWAEGQRCDASNGADDTHRTMVAALQARLTELYGNRGRAEVSGEPSAVRLRVTLPCCTADDEPASPAAEQRRPLFAASVRRIVIAVATWCTFAWLMFASWPMDPTVAYRSVLVTIVVASFMLLCASLTAFWLARAYPWVRDPVTNSGGGWRAAGAHVLASLSFGLCLFTGGVVFGVMVRHFSLSAAKHTVARLTGSVVTMLMVMLLFSVVAHAVEGLKRQRIKDVVVRRLQIALREARRRRVEAELRALTAELNPHFVGNALNAVLMLMRSDRAAAERVLIQLNDLLRTAMVRTGMQEVTLREELVTLRPFLAVEGARFGRDLEVKLALDDETLDGRVPHMILQPLVENAVKHGLAPRRGHGRIDIAAHRCDDTLEVIIRNDGIGLPDASSGARRRPGVGLAKTRARLSELYGDEARLDLTPAADGGTITRLTLPWCERSAQRPVRT